MSLSVRRLWTGAFMLSMGCQSVPSTVTNVFDAAPKSPSSHAAAERQERSRAANDDQQSAAKPTFPENPRPMETPFSGSAPEATAAGSASTPASRPVGEDVSTRDHSALHSLRTRLFGGNTEVTPIEYSESLPHSPLSLDDGADEDANSPVLPVGHDAPPSGRRRSFRDFDRILEAPTPFSALSRRTAAVERVETAAAGSPVEPPTPDGDEKPAPVDAFLDTPIDAFGIGGDRAGQAHSDAAAALREGSAVRLERAADRARSGPSVDARAKSLQTIHWQEELERLITLLETQLASQTPGESDIEQDYYIRQQVALRMLYLIGSRRPEALQVIPNCDPGQQEFWTEMLWALSNIFDDESMPDRDERTRETAARLRAALTHLTPIAGLKLARTQFCRQINGFGSYATFDRDEFAPGQAVLVYTEVENFVSTLTAEGDYVTMLQSTLRIQAGDVTGPIVFEEELPATEDRCLTRRRDYFHSYRISLPTHLTPGPHVLTLTMRDQNSHKVSMTSLNFVVR